ncbi:MAG: hypothetical protein ACOCV7_05345 [Desulfonatronovibrionaceae bacterium]
MGELVQIRVTAEVHDPEKVLQRWSSLAELAFDHQKQSPELPDKRILHQLIDALYDRLRLDSLPEQITRESAQDIRQAHDLKTSLEHSLADRDPQKADRISYELEDLLDRMEEKIRH